MNASFRRRAGSVFAIACAASALSACREAAPPPRDPARQEPTTWQDAMWLAKDEAAHCARPGLPEGRGRVDVTLDADGRVVTADLAVAPFKDTEVGACVLSVAKQMKLPAAHRPMKTQLRVVVGRDEGSWLRPGEFDRFAVDEQARLVERRIQRDCARWLDPDLHAELVFDADTGRVADVKLDSERLGGVGHCIESKLREIAVAPFDGAGTVRLALSAPFSATRLRPSPL